MAEIKITIPNNILPRVLTAICAQFGYQEYLNPPENTIPNTETRGEFCKRQIITILKQAVLNHEGRAAMIAARDLAEATVNSEINLT